MTQDETPSHTLKIPKSLIPFFDVFSVESEESAKLLFELAIESIYPQHSLSDFERHDLKESFYLMRDIKPKNDFEKILYAQVIVGHLLGMQKLSQDSSKDKRLALKFLKISNGAMKRIYNTPHGTHINITITR